MDTLSLRALLASLFSQDPHYALFREQLFYLVGYQSLDPWVIAEHDVPFYVVEILISRQGCHFEYSINDNKGYQYIKGSQAYFYPANSTYKSEWQGKLDEIIMLGIPVNYFEEILKQEYGVDSHLDWFSFQNLGNSLQATDALNFLYYYLYKEAREMRYGQSYQYSLFHTIIYSLLKDLLNQRSDISPDRFAADLAKQILEKEWCKREFQLAHLCELVQSELRIESFKLSDGKLRLLFKKYHGWTLQGYLNLLFFKSVFERLKQGTKAIEIMNEFEIDSRSNFNRRFKNGYPGHYKYKLTPTQLSRYFKFLQDHQDVLVDPEYDLELLVEEGGFGDRACLDEVMLLLFEKDLNDFRKIDIYD